jgi:hypothetical protein
MGPAWIARSERVAPWVAGLALAAPIVTVRYPPMGDLAMHEGLVAIMRHLHDPAWVPAGLYSVVAPQANQLFPFAALALSFAVPTDMACKLVVALSVALTPPLGARLLASRGRSRWLALLLGPIASGWMMRWGLVANMTGFAALVFAFPYAETFARRPSARTGGVASACACLVFFAHASSALVFGLVVGVFAVLRGRHLPGVAKRLAPLAVLALLAFVGWRESEGLLSDNMRAIGTSFGADPLHRLAILPGALFGALSSGRLAALSGVSALAILASSAGRRRVRSLPLRPALWVHRYALLGVLFVALYLVVPTAIGGTTLVAHRFLPPACLCIVVAAASRRSRTPVAVFALLAPLVLVVSEAGAFESSDARYRALDRIILLLPKNAAVAQLDLSPRPSGHVAPVPGAAGRVLAERGGRMLFALTDTPPNPVYIRPDLRWSEPIARLAMTPYAFMPAYDFTRFRYLLERNEDPRARDAVARALAPEAELLSTEGEWSLFRSRLATVPLTDPDAPLPSPAPETLGARLKRP